MKARPISDTANQDGTVGKALALLDEISAIGRPVRFKELQGISPLPKATLYRFLQILMRQNMLDYDEDRQTYSLGIRLMRLAHGAWSQTSLAPIAAPLITALSDRIGETVHLAQLDHGQVLYVDKRNAKTPLSMFSDAGKIGPGYCTGVGKAMMAFVPDATRADLVAEQSFHKYTDATITTAKALLAELDEIRKTGVAFDREEHEPNIICIAVPILGQSGRVLGGISVTSSLQRSSLEELALIKDDISHTAAQIGEQFSAWKFPDNTPKQEASCQM